MKIYVVIAAYNEEDNIGRVVKSLVSGGYSNIIVVDDGSSDKTSVIAEESGAEVIRHVTNRGQGAALQTSILAALEKEANIIITFDADGQHRVEDINKLIIPIVNGCADIVLGSRFLQHSEHVPFSRKVLLKGSLVVQQLFYGMKLTDVHNGLRALSRHAAKKIKLSCDGMAHSSEFVDGIKKNDLRFAEVPVLVRYTKDSLRKGHGSFRQALKVLYDMIANKLWR